MAELHVLDGAGRWQRGVDAFLVIWQHLPAYRWLAKLVVILGLRRPLGYAYRQFAAWRYRRRCTTDNCTIGDRERARDEQPHTFEAVAGRRIASGEITRHYEH
jgi:predicted DCC family thiol-disulfide oxidoreductase YuxK